MTVSSVCLVVTPAQFAERKEFYTNVLATLGYKEWRSDAKFIGFSDASDIPDFFIVAKDESERAPTRNVHVSFKAPDQETVRKFYDAAL
jgi:catechol 2,3-dioxygenase-like lactoylglutathione lyase family enzyme